MTNMAAFNELDRDRKVAVCIGTAEQIFAFKSRVMEAQKLISDIPVLNATIDGLVEKMNDHAMVLLSEAFHLTQSCDDSTSEKKRKLN